VNEKLVVIEIKMLYEVRGQLTIDGVDSELSTRLSTLRSDALTFNSFKSENQSDYTIYETLEGFYIMSVTYEIEFDDHQSRIYRLYFSSTYAEIYGYLKSKGIETIAV
jgi:hypothetical protein